MQLSLNALDKALRLADQAIDIDPHDSRAWALRAHIEQTTGQFELALGDLHRALEFNHVDRQLLLETAELYRQLNRPQRALATLTSLCDTYAPGEEPQQVLYLEGLSLSAMGRHDDATDAYALALDHGPPTPELLARLSESELAAGRTQEADQAVQRAWPSIQIMPLAGRCVNESIWRHGPERRFILKGESRIRPNRSVPQNRHKRANRFTKPTAGVCRRSTRDLDLRGRKYLCAKSGAKNMKPCRPLSDTS